MAIQLTQRMLDRLLPRAVSTATAPGGIRVTEGQLYYELCRLLVPVHRLPRRLPFTTPVPLPYSAFRATLDRHGPIPELLTRPAASPAGIGRHTAEPDLFDYGLPRLLICGSDDIAHMLRANGLPMESACPVLGAAELPLHPGMAAMLERVRGTVYLLHEAGDDGMGFPAGVRASARLPENARIVPIGLHPRQARSLHLFHTGPGHTVELEAVRPAALLRTVHRLVRGVRGSRRPPLELRRARHAGFLTWPSA